jgi:hypothetical protein
MRAPSPRRARNHIPVARFVLPVSGLTVALRQPTGTEDLLLAEGRIEDPNVVLALAERLAETESGTDWTALPVVDVDTLIVRLRQIVVGQRVVAEIACGNSSCGQIVDLSFEFDAYLEHHQPRRGGRRGWRTEPDTEAAGWFLLQADNGARVRFRLPTLGDQIAVAHRPGALAALAARCIHSETLSGRVRTRVEAAMTALAPPLAGTLQGRCPDCGASIEAWFDARLYCLQELRDRARFVHDDVDTLAERYHWSERAILTLPQVRRTEYVERARQALAG